ncbi:uncharacterized protein LOC133929845 [Phragmites australis]|uniref:uncharacterized protein LOC133929845 n=1 Tax=Phragmites australis TaxID=29695 RepID=UPI002D76D393|nr:uncharacterized protein LOC133929845 [Phragmites australis]
MDRIHRNQYGSKSSAHRGAAAASTSSGAKRKGKGAAGGGGGGGGKKPIKVVYIGNPVRVTTSAASFRALVQELTGRHADPSRYTGGSGAAIDVDAEDSSGASLQAEPQSGAEPSPVSTDVSSDAAAAGGHVPAPAWEYDDDEDSFSPQLIDNSYSMFSPPTFLYSSHNEL